MPSQTDALINVVLASVSQDHGSALSESEDRQQAVEDLKTSASFAPVGLVGPFVINLSLDGGRLLLDVRDGDDRRLRLVILSLGPFRRLIKDYQLLVDSHERAIQDGCRQMIQTIDMGRRGLHDEGGMLMIDRLAGKITIDFETARRMFTLLFVLQRRI